MTESDWSVPESAVYAAARDHLADGDPAVLATVVDVEGSAYRRPGAKMLVGPEGEGVGHVTAGCLESEVAALARDVLSAGEPRIERYDLTADDEDVWGMGIGCEGVVDVLLEPLGDRHRPAVAAFHGEGAVVSATVVESDDVAVGERFYFHPTRAVETAVGDPPYWLRTGVQDVGTDLLAQGGAATVDVDTLSGAARVFVEAVSPPPELVVVGSGHDVGPVVELAAKNGFRVTVTAFRGGADVAKRFPRAERTITTSPADLGDALDVDDETYTVVMTHNFVDDRLAVEALLDADAAYVGLMGPRERFEDMRAAFEAEDRAIDEEALDRVYAPVGLDLGSRTPYQIATSIVAEALAVRADRDPEHLRGRDGPIHGRLDVGTPDAEE